MAGIYGQLIGAQAEIVAVLPSAGKRGRIVFLTTDSLLYLDTGSTYIALASGTKLSTLFPIILGSSAQVTAGSATHSTWATAISAASDGDFILVLEGSWTENVSISKRLCIAGQGNGSVIDGTLTFTTAANNASLTSVRVNDNITLDSGADYINLTNFWQATGKTVTDSGTGNYIQGIRE